jgi:hypothetical protein
MNANPITSCGLRESEVNAIMEAKIAAWLETRGLSKTAPRAIWPKAPWPQPPCSEAKRQRISASNKAAWARKRLAKAAAA